MCERGTNLYLVCSGVSPCSLCSSKLYKALLACSSLPALLSAPPLFPILVPHTSGDILVFLTGQAEIEKAIHKINAEVSMLPEGSAGPLLALPLHASLPPELQVKCNERIHSNWTNGLLIVCL